MNGREAVEQARALGLDVAVLDLSMPVLNGIEATRQIRRECPGTAVLILTMQESEGLMRDVLTAGARGFVLKTDTARLLVSALEALAEGRPFFTGKVGEMVLSGFLERTLTEQFTNIVLDVVGRFRLEKGAPSRISK